VLIRLSLHAQNCVDILCSVENSGDVDRGLRHPIKDEVVVEAVNDNTPHTHQLGTKTLY